MTKTNKMAGINWLTAIDSATSSRRTLKIAIDESTACAEYHHIAFANLLTSLVTHGRYTTVQASRVATHRPHEQLKAMLDLADIEILKAYEQSITELLDFGFDYHAIKDFLTAKQKRSDLTA